MSNGDQPTPQTDAPQSDASYKEADDQPPATNALSEAPPPQSGPSSSAERSTTGRVARGSGPLAARGLGVAKPSSPTAGTGSKSTDAEGTGASTSERGSPGERSKREGKKPAPRPRLAGERQGDREAKPEQVLPDKPAAEGGGGDRSKVAIPGRRRELPDELQAELDAQLAGADIDSMLGGAAGMPDRREPLAEGTRVHAQVVKVYEDSVFAALGGPDEGSIPLEQFEAEPQPGQSVEVIVRGFNPEDGLYVLTLPGQAVDVDDWSDLEEGAVVEATVTGSNSGGLECKVGQIRGFIPLSQVSEYRVEDVSDFVDQKLVCLVTEANSRRGNLVLSRRAVLEREREEKRKEQLEKIEPGDVLEGTVRSVKDFGAFVDLGGLDGLIHVSKLSWERIKHPGEAVEEGQQVKVKVESVDKQTGKIGLSYRDLLENPWDRAEVDFPVGSVHRGTVSRIANFGCFVRLAPGVEGLVHISEIAHHRVSKVGAFVNEGEEVEVKVLSFDREAQKIGLSIKAAQSSAEPTTASAARDETPEPPRDVAVKPTHSGPLRGGNDRSAGGERFGLRW